MILSSILDVIVPRLCFSCEAGLKQDERVICKICLHKIKEAEADRIAREYQKDFSEKKFISGLASLFMFEKDKELQTVIHYMKYKKKFVIGSYLGNLLGQKHKGLLNDWHIDLVIPVPLHHKRYSERSYNHSYYIANGFCKCTGAQLNKKILKRVKYTFSQTKMTLEERQVNVKDAFKVTDKELVKSKNILLIDDVITTGSTIQECAGELITAGASKVYALSVAIAD